LLHTEYRLLQTTTDDMQSQMWLSQVIYDPKLNPGQEFLLDNITLISAEAEFDGLRKTQLK